MIPRVVRRVTGMPTFFMAASTFLTFPAILVLSSTIMAVPTSWADRKSTYSEAFSTMVDREEMASWMKTCHLRSFSGSVAIYRVDMGEMEME